MRILKKKRISIKALKIITCLSQKEREKINFGSLFSRWNYQAKTKYFINWFSNYISKSSIIWIVLSTYFRIFRLTFPQWTLILDLSTTRICSVKIRANLPWKINFTWKVLEGNWRLVRGIAITRRLISFCSSLLIIKQDGFF